jgi:uncharacterized protein YjbI with pentapeptide repeats
MFNVDLSQSKLTNPSLYSASLYSVDLSKADLQGADFSDARLRDVDLRDVTSFQNANFSRAQLDNVSFAPKTWQGAGADLRGVNFRFAKLSRVDFSRANVSGAFFYGAEISKRTDFAGVDWWRADFSYGESVDGPLLQDFYTRYRGAIPDEIDIDADVHPSVQDFLKAALHSDPPVQDSET